MYSNASNSNIGSVDISTIGASVTGAISNLNSNRAISYSFTISGASSLLDGIRTGYTDLCVNYTDYTVISGALTVSSYDSGSYMYCHYHFVFYVGTSIYYTHMAGSKVVIIEFNGQVIP